ncbi:MAG TPA: hypothetical protein VFJ52_02440 [Terriglobia bacterium]|nr:hypothetical protein [Terriglobia bacterium]
MKNVAQELWYTYVTPQTLVNANATTTALVVAINRGGDFLLQRLVAVSLSGGAFSAQISDAGKQLNFTNDFVDSRLMFGTAQLWAPVIPEYLFPYNGAIGYSLKDTSAANNTIQLGFIGKVVPAGTFQPQAAQGHPQGQGSGTPMVSEPGRVSPGGNFYHSQDAAMSGFFRGSR